MPAFSAIGAYVAGTLLGLAGTAAVVVGAIVATGAAFITSRIINGNPNKGGNSAAGSQGGRIQVPPATNNKIPVVYGSAFVNGTITDARLISTDQKTNNTMYYCIVLSETCNNPSATYNIDNVYWNDLRLTAVDSTTNAHKVKDGRKTVDGPGEDFIDTNFIVDNKSLVELRVYAGSTAAAKQIYPLQSSGNTTPAYTFWGGNDGSWDSTYEMKGLVFAIVKVTYNGEKGFTGLPNMTFQLANNVNNPADVWYDYMTSSRYGAGIDSSYIDSTAQTAWANFCNEDINYTDKDGTANQYTERYTINGVIDTAQPVKTNIDTILQNGGAWMSYNVATGLWSPIIKKAITAGSITDTGTFFTASRSGTTLTVTNFPEGRIEAGQELYNSTGTFIGTITAQITPLTSGETTGQKGRYTTSTSGSISSTTFYTLTPNLLQFDDDNIISGISLSSTRLDDLYNKVESEFYDKHNKDQKAYFRNDLPSGERNPNEPDNQLRLSLDLVNNSMQADLLGQLELRQSRDDLVIEFTTNHYGIQAQAGDIIGVTSELYDWAPKYFRVMRVKEQETEDGGLVATIQALEYNADAYTIEPITEFTTEANIGIGVYGSSPNLPAPPVVYITEIDTNVAIPNFQLQVKIPDTGGPYDEIELYYTEGWDPMDISGSIVPGTGSNGAPVGQGLMTVTSTPYGSINTGDYFDLGGVAVVSQITNNPVSKTYSSGGAVAANTVTLNNTTGLIIGNNLMGTGLGTYGAHITAIAGSQVTLDNNFTEQAAGTYTVTGGLGTYIVNTSLTASGTDTLYDLPINSDYKYLKKHTPEGDNPTFTNGETVTITITEVPANTQTYRRWFVKARLGIKKRFGAFSDPSTTDRDGNFRYQPSPTGGGSLNDLTDVVITTPTLGNFLWYNGTDWINSNDQQVNTRDQTLRLTRTSTSAGEDYEDEVALRLNDRVTDAANNLTDEGGPAIRFERSSGASGTPVAFGQITMEWFGTTNDHKFKVVTSTDEFDPGTGTPPPYPNSTVLLESTRKYTKINDGVLYVDKTNSRVGINNTSPSYELHIDNGGDSMTQFAMTNNERTFLLSNNAGDDLLSFNYGGANRLQFNTTDQWFNSGKLGINNSSPAYTLDVTGEAYINSTLTVHGSTYLGNNYITDETHITGEFKVINNSVDNLFVDHTTGYVGINDNTPSYNLDVNGTANIETSLTVPSISTLVGDPLSITAYSGQDVTITANLSTNPVVIARNTANTNAFTRSARFQVNSTGTPAAGLTNALEFYTETAPTVFKSSGYISNRVTNVSTGSESFDLDFWLLKNNVITNVAVLDSSGNLQIDGDLTVSGNTINSSSAAAIELSGANVTVQGDLSVKGTSLVLNSDGTGTEDVSITVERGLTDATITWDETNDKWTISNGATIGNIDIDLTNGQIDTNGGVNLTLDSDGGTVLINDNLNVDSGVLYVDATNNRVGINNTSPTTALDVTGSILASGDIQGSSITATSRIDTDGVIEQYSDTFGSASVETQVFQPSITGNTILTADSWSTSTYRTAKYTLSMSKSTSYHCIEMMIIHDGTTAYMTQYNEIITGSSLATFTADISGGNVRLRITPATTGTLLTNIERKLFSIVV